MNIPPCFSPYRERWEFEDRTIATMKLAQKGLRLLPRRTDEPTIRPAFNARNALPCDRLCNQHVIFLRDLVEPVESFPDGAKVVAVENVGNVAEAHQLQGQGLERN